MGDLDIVDMRVVDNGVIVAAVVESEVVSLVVGVVSEDC